MQRITSLLLRSQNTTLNTTFNNHRQSAASQLQPRLQRSISSTRSQRSKSTMASSSQKETTNEQRVVTEFIEDFNKEYLKRHKSYEDNFWETKMD